MPGFHIGAVAHFERVSYSIPRQCRPSKQRAAEADRGCGRKVCGRPQLGLVPYSMNASAACPFCGNFIIRIVHNLIMPCLKFLQVKYVQHVLGLPHLLHTVIGRLCLAVLIRKLLRECCSRMLIFRFPFSIWCTSLWIAV